MQADVKCPNVEVHSVRHLYKSTWWCDLCSATFIHAQDRVIDVSDKKIVKTHRMPVGSVDGQEDLVQVVVIDGNILNVGWEPARTG